MGVIDTRAVVSAGGGPDGAEDFAMGAADFFPVFRVSEEHAGAEDVSEGGAGLDESFFDEAENNASLLAGGEVFCADGPGAGDVDDVADADGARESDDGFVGR